MFKNFIGLAPGSTSLPVSGSKPKRDKSELVFRTPSGSKKGVKRKCDFSEDSSSNDADHLFREAASKTTEQVSDPSTKILKNIRYIFLEIENFRKFSLKFENVRKHFLYNYRSKLKLSLIFMER